MIVRQLVERTSLGQRFMRSRRSRQMDQDAGTWEARGRPLPAPARHKQQIILGYAAQFRPRIFIETGTFRGDMVYAVRDAFPVIHSIELSESLYRGARVQFKHDRHIAIHHGDSATVLARLLAGISEPCLFWLDGHYSGPHSSGWTARGQQDTPIEQELDAIFRHSVRDHVVLVDDAREFKGGAYPTIDDVRRRVDQERPEWRVTVEDDIIRMHPDAVSSGARRS
jgi:hypothetical protein